MSVLTKYRAGFFFCDRGPISDRAADLRDATQMVTRESMLVRLNGTVDTVRIAPNDTIVVRRVRRRCVDGRLQSVLAGPDVIRASSLRVGDRLGQEVPVERAGTAMEFVAGLGDPQRIVRGGPGERAVEHEAFLSRVRVLQADAPALWFLLGVYLGDGYRRPSRHEVVFCVGASDGELAERVRTSLAAVGLSASEDVSGGPRNIKIRVHSRHLSAIAGVFGDGADRKEVPQPLMSVERPLLDALFEAAADACAVSVHDVLGASRDTCVARARHVIAYLLRRDFRLSYPEIGMVLGRDHTTAIHAVRRVEASAELLEFVERVRAHVQEVQHAAE